MRVIRAGVAALRAVGLTVVLIAGLPTGTAVTAAAADVENLMVSSAAMGRDIPVTFLGGGPHAVFLLDAFNGGDAVSNWVTAGNAMNTLAGKGVSVVAPAGGAYSLYTDWEQDGSKQWETFLTGELPSGLAANKGLTLGGHAVVGAAQGGTAPSHLPNSTPIGSGTRARCRVSCIRPAPRSTVRSPRVWRSSAGWTPATCGGCLSWAGGSGTILTFTPGSW
jgi:S-formylglutathione hydrolase FrmB